MRYVILLIPVLLTQLSFAADSESVNAIKLLNEVMVNPPKAAIDASCVACAANSEIQNDLFCENLFEAACFNKDGSHVKKNTYKTRIKESHKTIKDARNETARALGFKDTSAYLMEKLKENGLPVTTEPEPGHWDSLIEEDVDEDYGNINKLKFNPTESCTSDKLAIDELPEEQRLEKYKVFNKKYNDERNKVFAKNISDFIKSVIKDRCDDLKWAKTSNAEASNERVEYVCKNFMTIKKEAVNLYMKEGAEGYSEKALAFVERYQVPDINYDSGPVDETKLEVHTEQAKKICEKLTKTMHSFAKNIVEEHLSNIAKAKPTVEYLINNVYTKERKNISHRLLNRSVDSIQKFLPTITQDKNKIAKIKNGYRKISLDWMVKPGEDTYETGSVFNKIPVLKQVTDDADANFPFMDYHLDKFKTINAYYSPEVRSEVNKGVERVFMLPSFIATLDDSPYEFLAVVAHEAGHKLGPQVSKFNGHDLGEEWKELLQCYEKQNSIKLKTNQLDETIADYISSTVLSDVISKLPASERRNALKASIQPFCVFDDGANQRLSFYCNESHPEYSLRISGIYGANPVLREVVGCNQPSSQFQSCGLKKAKHK